MIPNLSAGLERVRNRFLEELPERSLLLHRAYDMFDFGAVGDGPLQDICDVAHKIAGTAGTLGFGELGKQAALIDDLIRTLPNDKNIGEVTVRAEIIKLMELTKNPK